MKKIILPGVAILLVIGLAAGVVWWLTRPQAITFSDDSKLILLGADYGRRHTVPGGKLPKGPPRAGAPANRTGNSTFQTPTDMLVVWVRAKYDYTPNQPASTTGRATVYQPNQNPNFQFYVYDQSGTACASASTRNVTGQRGDDVLAFQFNTFPRREGKVVLRAQESYGGGQEMADSKFLVPNPAAKKTFAKWTAEPMPDRQTDGDLAVTLTKLLAGADMPYQRNQDNPDDAMNKGVQLAFHLERNGKPVSNWAPAALEFTDATGNRSAINYGQNGGNQVKWNGDEGVLTYQNSLWPDEPAWKLRMEMSQTSDFSSDESWTAQNIPVVPGSQQSFNGLAGVRGGAVVVRGAPPGRGAAPVAATPPAPPTPCAEADLGDHHIKVFPVVQFTNQTVAMSGGAVYTQPLQAGLMVQIQPAVSVASRLVNVAQTTDDGMRLTLAKVTDDQGGELRSYNSGTSTAGTMGSADSSSTFRFTFQNTDGVTNITATIAIHKNRFYEFTVKPEKAAANQN